MADLCRHFRRAGFCLSCPLYQSGAQGPLATGDLAGTLCRIGRRRDDLCGVDLINVRLTVPDLGGGILGLALIVGTIICFGLHWFDQSAARGPTLPDHVLERRVGTSLRDVADLLGLLRLATSVGVLSIAVGQIFDPRYRDFPIATYILPAVAFAAESIRRQRWARIAAGPVEQFLCWALVICAGAILLREGVENIQAVGFVIIMIMLSLRIATAGKPVPVF